MSLDRRRMLSSARSSLPTDDDENYHQWTVVWQASNAHTNRPSRTWRKLAAHRRGRHSDLAAQIARRHCRGHRLPTSHRRKSLTVGIIDIPSIFRSASLLAVSRLHEIDLIIFLVIGYLNSDRWQLALSWLLTVVVHVRCLLYSWRHSRWNSSLQRTKILTFHCLSVTVRRRFCLRATAEQLKERSHHSSHLISSEMN